MKRCFALPLLACASGLRDGGVPEPFSHSSPPPPPLPYRSIFEVDLIQGCRRFFQLLGLAAVLSSASPDDFMHAPSATKVFYPYESMKNGTFVQGWYNDLTRGGESAGVGSASYDYYLYGPPEHWIPEVKSVRSPVPNEGAVLLALNPYTGKVSTQIPAASQYFAGGNTGYASHASLGTPEDFAAAQGVTVTAESDPIEEGAGTNDHIFFTTERRGMYMGLYMTISKDGTLLTTKDPYFPWMDQANDPYYVAEGETISFDLGTVVEYHPDTPNWSPVWAKGRDSRLYTGFGFPGIWLGQAGDAGTHYVGFALDGYFGWVKLQISGDRAGLILKEYYFDFNATSGGGTLG